MAPLTQFSGAMLFVPGDRPDRFDKAVATGADHVVIDLEDAVGEDAKDVARQAAVAWLGAGGQAVVRVNALSTPHHRADLDAVGSFARAVVLPKAEDPRTVEALVGACPAPVLALVETPAGVVAAAALASSGVAGLLLGNVDLAASLGVDPASHPALLTARSTLVYASAAAGLAPPVDGVTTDLRSPSALAADLAQARELGFGGRLCLHPDQVRPTQQAFAPTEGEVRWARAVVAGVVGTGGTGSGVLAVDGQMVDAPVLRRARAILARVP